MFFSGILFLLSSNLNNFDFVIEKCLFGIVKLTKNAHIHKYKYSGYSIGFESHGTFFHSGKFGQNVTIFGVDMGSSVHNKRIDILILGEGPTQGLDGTELAAEKTFN